jgi:hypothetical protein
MGQVLEEESHVLLDILWAEEWSQGTAVRLNCVVFGYYACCFVQPPSFFLSLQALSLSPLLHNTVAEVWKLGAGCFNRKLSFSIQRQQLMLAKHVVRVWRIEAVFSLLCLSNKMDISMM